MDGRDLITTVQALCLAAWLLPAALFAFGMIRSVRRRGRSGDQLRSAAWFVAFVNILFPLRWIVYRDSLPDMPLDQLASWTALYVVGTVSALYLTYTVWDHAGRANATRS